MAILPKQSTQIAAIKPPTEGKEEYLGEGKDVGLMLMVTAKGTKTWFVRYYAYRKGVKKRPKYKIGRFPAIGLSEARATKLDVLAKVERGEDPAKDKKIIDRQSSFKSVETMIEVFFKEREVEKYKGRLRRNVKDEQSIAKCYIAPIIGSYSPHTVARDDIEEILSKAQKTCSAVRANRVLALTRVLFKYALLKKYIDLNPTDGINPPGKESPREIDPPKSSELKELWKLIENGVKPKKGNPVQITQQIQLVLKLLLLTGQRSAEVAQAPIDEFDLEDKVWIISGERTKNGKPHKIPLSKVALSLVKEAIKLAQKAAPKTKYLFPGWPGRKGNKRGVLPIGKTAPYHAFKRVVAGTKLDRFTVHDFRKICATQMAELGVLMEIVSEILNHSINTVTARHYAKPSYLPQMREALGKWENHLMKIVEDKNE